MAATDRSPAALARAVQDQARALGFDACAIAAAGPIGQADRLREWLGRGHHAGMHWMARQQALREDARTRLPGARSVVVLARNYYHRRPDAVPGAGQVSRYAWGRDYHRVLRRPLKALAQFIASLGEGVQCYASADSGPVQERAWAAQAGLGWIGRNSMALRRDMGSWFFLATVITTLELEPGSPIPDYCGACRLCVDACPTSAIVPGRMVDSNRCISYLTIENRGEIPEALRPRLNGWVFGCDICQEVCPWNKYARQTNESEFLPRPGQANPDLESLVSLTEEAFLERFAGTPLMRAKRSGMARNARAVMASAPPADAAGPCDAP